MEESKAVEPIDLGKRKWKIHEFRIRCKGSTFKPQAANTAAQQVLMSYFVGLLPVATIFHFTVCNLQSL